MTEAESVRDVSKDTCIEAGIAAAEVEGFMSAVGVCQEFKYQMK